MKNPNMMKTSRFAIVLQAARQAPRQAIQYLQGAARWLVGLESWPEVRDISFYQYSFNGPGLASRHVALMIRAGQNQSVDTAFMRHYNNAIKDGVKFGMYWFFQPNTAYGPQLAAFLNLYNSLPWKPPVIALDVEDIRLMDGTVVLPPNAEWHTAHLLGWLRGVEQATGHVPGIYTRQNYWDQWTIAGSGFDHYWLWVACWTSFSTSIIFPRDWAVKKNWTLWQYEGGTGRDVDIPGPVDLNRFNGSQEQSDTFFGTAEVPMTQPVYTMDPSLCGRILTISDLDAREKIAMANMGLDEIIIKAGGSDSADHQDYQSTSWDARQKEAESAGLAHTMWIGLDWAWYRANQIDKAALDKWSGHPDQHKLMLRVLRCLSRDPSATWAMMSTWGADSPNWRKVNALMFSQYNDDYQGQGAGDVWFSLGFTDIIDQVKALMDGEKIPKLPITLKCTPELLAKYARTDAQQLGAWLGYKPATVNDAPARNSWLKLAYGGKTVWTLNEAVTQIPSLADCWQWAYVNCKTDKIFLPYAGNQWVEGFAFVPDGYVVDFHETSGNRLYSPTYTDSLGNNRPGLFSLSPRMTRAQLKEYLQADITPPPPPPPPSGEVTLEMFQALQDQVNTLQSRVVTVENNQTSLVDTVKIILKKLADAIYDILGAPSQ